MSTSLSLRKRPSIGISEAATRRLQTGVWLVTLALAIALSGVMLPQLIDDAMDLSDLDLTPAEQVTFRQHVEELGISVRTLAIVGLAGAAVQEALVVAISAVLLRKRVGGDWFAFYISLIMIAGVGAMYPPALHDLVNGNAFWLSVGKTLTGLSVTSLFLIPLLFPTGRFAPRWMAIPAALVAVAVLSFVIAPGEDAGDGTNPALEALTNAAILAVMAGSIVYRYRKLATPIQRQQMKWGVTGAAIALPAFLAGDALMRSIDGSFTGVLATIGWSIAMPIANLAFPICLTVAILKHRLWDIDLYLSHTLVWVFMTTLVIAGYMGIVFGIGSRIGGDQTTVLSLIALGLTTVFFQPVRQRAQGWINRLLFGERDDPYRVVRQLATDLAETIQPAEALHATVRTLTETLRLPYAAITLEPDSAPLAMAGYPGSTELLFPLVYQSQPVGQLIVSPRGGARDFDATDRRLLEDLVRQIGVVAHNVRLTNDLQASRERIVTAREEERRRLRRDLHDGLGGQLSALTLQAGVVKAMIHDDPDGAMDYAVMLQQELQIAVADIRRLVQGLRPAALDDLGLLGALENRISSVTLSEGNPPSAPTLSVQLIARDELGDLPAAVEVAIYRIVDASLTNVVRHAEADRCVIRVARNDAEICLTIEDNGIGIPTDRISGVGLQSMRERALELGGSFATLPAEPHGTRIVAILPVTGRSAS